MKENAVYESSMALRIDSRGTSAVTDQKGGKISHTHTHTHTHSMSRDSLERREVEGKPVSLREGRDGEGFQNGWLVKF